MIRKSLVVGLAFMALSSAALSQGGGGAGGGAGGASSGGGTSSSNSGASAMGAQPGQAKSGLSTTTSGNNNRNNNAVEQEQPNDSRAMPPAQRAQTGVDTRPQNETPGAVSAPGVGVGHSANGLPIGSPGSGLGSPEEPVDAKKH